MPGGAVIVEDCGGELRLKPAAMLEVELYSDEHIAEWDQALTRNACRSLRDSKPTGAYVPGFAKLPIACRDFGFLMNAPALGVRDDPHVKRWLQLPQEWPSSTSMTRQPAHHIWCRESLKSELQPERIGRTSPLSRQHRSLNEPLSLLSQPRGVRAAGAPGAGAFEPGSLGGGGGAAARGHVAPGPGARRPSTEPAGHAKP